MRNLVANSRTAWLEQSVCVMGGSPWLWGLVGFGQAQPTATSLGGNHRPPLPKSSTSFLTLFPPLSRYPQGLASPVTSSHIPGLLGHHLERICVFLCVTLRFFPGVPCFIIILITVVLSFMLLLTFICGLVMLFICL